jgi:hypothetical protein
MKNLIFSMVMLAVMWLPAFATTTAIPKCDKAAVVTSSTGTVDRKKAPL